MVFSPRSINIYAIDMNEQLDYNSKKNNKDMIRWLIAQFFVKKSESQPK